MRSSARIYCNKSDMATSTTASHRIRVLFIVSLPPPMTGQALASQTLIDEMARTHDVSVVNMNKPSLVSGVGSIGRVLDVFKIIGRVARAQASAEVIYFTISESRAGNLKDVCIMAVCWRKLARMAIHLQGGAGLTQLLKKNFVGIGSLNRFFHRRVAGVVVEGGTQRQIFLGAVQDERIHVVPNFAEDQIFLSPERIERKFAQARPLRVLFLSNLIRGKGHEELLGAYAALSLEERTGLELDFAGGFENPRQRKDFLDRIAAFPNVRYHGVVGGSTKVDLFQRSHIFALPTYYPYEGQPLSILEAYAAGCVVITTAHSGIPDVFCDSVNGFVIEKKSAASVCEALRSALSARQELTSIALHNRLVATERYTERRFKLSLTTLIETLAESENLVAGQRNSKAGRIV